MVEYEARIFQACGHGSKFIEPPMLNVDCSMQGMSSLVSECGFPRHDRDGITEGATFNPLDTLGSGAKVRVALSGDLTILAQLCVEGREVKLAGRAVAVQP